MRNDEAAPIDHSTGSAVGTTVGGTAGGALKGGFKTALGWLALTVIGGALLGFALSTGGLAGLLPAIGSAISTVASALFSLPLWMTIGGAVAGGFLFAATWPFVTGAGAAVGGITGGVRAHRQVNDERAAAASVDAQVAALQTQAAMQDAGQGYGYPAQGSRYNMAASSIQADSAQRDGMISGAQLAAARG